MRFLFIILFIAPSLKSFAQEADTLSLQDTLRTGLFGDTLLVHDTIPDKSYDIDTTIFANASDSLIFYVNKKKMSIYGEASLQYKQTDLKSENIFVDFETNFIEAEGIPSDSVQGKLVGTPVLKEGADAYEGIRMKYNFKTRQGFISSAGTESEGARYTGEKIKKVDEETYFIEDGIYTTCEIDTPHYHFYSNEMKVIHKEQIVAKWIWLHFGGVPFPFPLPFAVFPIESGRRSGIIPPVFGDDFTYGRYFSRFGYFWAISDYMDWNLTGDFYTRGSYNTNSRFRYAKRYNFTGQLEGNYKSFKTGESLDPDRQESIDWFVKWNHNQSITPTLRFDANLQFVSGVNYSRRTIYDLNEILSRDIISNATLSKTWDESGNSATLNYSRTQNLDQNRISEVLPRASFNMSQKYPFRSKTTSGDYDWYELIGFNYSSIFQNNRNKVGNDLKIRGGIQHDIRTSASPKVGYFSVTPSISYQERWYNKRIEKEFAGLDTAGNDVISERDVKEINFVRTFNLGVGASTKFYGIVQPNVLGISAIRHIVNPSVSYSYTPDFSKSFWGYFDTYTNSKGEVIQYNKFEDEVFGGPSQGERQNISFSVSNIFEMKTTVDPTDTTSKEEKIQLLNLDGSISYNFAADSVNFSPLNVGFRTQVGNWFSFNGNSSYTLYETNEYGQNINKFLIEQGRGLLRLTNFSFSVSTSLSGEKLSSSETEEQTSEYQANEFQLGGAERNYKGIYDIKDPDFTIPWDISLNYNYSLDKRNPADIRTYSNISSSLNFNLTPKWKFSFSGSYDFERKEFAAPVVRISRDLHCWLLNFTWNPIGTYRGYSLEIRVKAPQLQDLKVTKRDRFYSGY
ncbi:MAG: putative LPS assembly protein LptD [Ignavibacteria bacterium]|nr:putative LPS assembly protein LptD [Ignavibacteria bacterium]